MWLLKSPKKMAAVMVEKVTVSWVLRRSGHTSEMTAVRLDEGSDRTRGEEKATCAYKAPRMLKSQEKGKRVSRSERPSEAQLRVLGEHKLNQQSYPCVKAQFRASSAPGQGGPQFSASPGLSKASLRETIQYTGSGYVGNETIPRPLEDGTGLHLAT